MNINIIIHRLLPGMNINIIKHRLLPGMNIEINNKVNISNMQVFIVKYIDIIVDIPIAAGELFDNFSPILL